MLWGSQWPLGQNRWKPVGAVKQQLNEKNQTILTFEKCVEFKTDVFLPSKIIPQLK